jgi:hypothetical protein
MAADFYNLDLIRGYFQDENVELFNVSMRKNKKKVGILYG